MDSRPITNKKKLINDPVYGFITCPHEIIFDLIEHPIFQRLRRIRQLGLSHLVYPGAMHTRFHHALGAMHLTGIALETLQGKGIEISADEKLATQIAVLLHDIGHGPFSHALEHSLIAGVHHEEISLLLMHKLNQDFNQQLTLAISIFTNKYPKLFLHQLVSSQLDMDRLDYLNRDSFFTGVSEGVIGWDRIIRMLHVANNQLVVEEKAIYSIEKFLIARRIMYWQVYLHKTSLAAEMLLVSILKRAKEIAAKGEQLFATPALAYFLYETLDEKKFRNDLNVIDNFIQIDDFDIMASIKVWQTHADEVLAHLCKRIINRKLFKIELFNYSIDYAYLTAMQQAAMNQLNLTPNNIDYYINSGLLSHTAYSALTDQIMVLRKDGRVEALADLTDHFNLRILSEAVKKYYIYYPKELEINW